MLQQLPDAPRLKAEARNAASFAQNETVPKDSVCCVYPVGHGPVNEGVPRDVSDLMYQWVPMGHIKRSSKKPSNAVSSPGCFKPQHMAQDVSTVPGTTLCPYLL